MPEHAISSSPANIAMKRDLEWSRDSALQLKRLKVFNSLI